MMALAARLRNFASSLTGRLVLILTIGIASASIASLFVAEHVRQHDLQRVRWERVIVSTADIAARLARDPVHTAELLDHNRILGARAALPQWPTMRPDGELSRLLRARLGAASRAEAMAIPRNLCFPDLDISLRAAGMGDFALPDCWYVRFRDVGGVERRLSIDIVPLRLPRGSTLDPLYLFLIVVASLILSLLVSRFATAPLRRLAHAAHTFSITIDPEPIPESGPREVRAALATFNLMQRRVRHGFRERTQILAAITHDLQTPLTRLRLRLEQVGDDMLRDRLIADLGETQRLVRDGLELARSSESREPWSVVDIDSILSSVAEDAAEVGGDARFVGGCGARSRVKPNALARCLTNLVGNAIKYAGDAELACMRSGRNLLITVRDHGPGIPDEALHTVFEPFHRLAGETRGAAGGSGLGLTIAKAQAETFGASLTLRNMPDGGLIAEICLADGI
jgi:signal transduction histidine kinase